MLLDGGLMDCIGSLLLEKLQVQAESPDLDLLESGLVDSVGLVELILELEQHFGIDLPVENLEVEDFRSIRSLARLVARSMPATAEGSTTEESNRT
jgi:D-alanine--poly(phosphoribitol) ligase subunit 2